jgi:hypothetical protein
MKKLNISVTNISLSLSDLCCLSSSREGKKSSIILEVLYFLMGRLMLLFLLERSMIGLVSFDLPLLLFFEGVETRSSCSKILDFEELF